MADRVSRCPQCLAIARRVQDATLDAARAMYGQVTQDEYNAVIQAVPVIGPNSLMTLGEEWMIGMDEAGLVTVDYRASCGGCGFRFGVEKSWQAYVTTGEEPELDDPVAMTLRRWLSVACPFCEAIPGQPCFRRPTGEPVPQEDTHMARKLRAGGDPL